MHTGSMFTISVFYQRRRDVCHIAITICFIIMDSHVQVIRTSYNKVGFLLQSSKNVFSVIVTFCEQSLLRFLALNIFIFSLLLKHFCALIFSLKFQLVSFSRENLSTNNRTICKLVFKKQQIVETVITLGCCFTFLQFILYGHHVICQLSSSPSPS